MGTSAWPFPKEHYHPKVILMNIQDLLNPRRLNHNPCSLKENLSQLEHELSLCQTSCDPEDCCSQRSISFQ